MKSEKVLTPMTENEKMIAKALGMCTYLPGSSQKRFAGNISYIANNSAEITEPQRKYLYLLAIRMRRQLSSIIIGIIPKEYWKQYEEQKENRKRGRI